MTDADVARLLTDLTRMAARLAEIEARDFRAIGATPGLAADAQGDSEASLAMRVRQLSSSARRSPATLVGRAAPTGAHSDIG